MNSSYMIVLAVALLGCAAPTRNQLTEQTQAVVREGQRKSAEIEEARKTRREAYVQAHPEFRQAILNGQIAVGMSHEDVIASWEKPDHVNTTVSASGNHEQWVYDVVPAARIYSRAYVYFENERVSSWQQSE